MGDRLASLRAAVELLEGSDGIEVVGHSSVYETEPVGQVTAQRDFLNAVVSVETALAPHELLAACKRVESRLGRDPAVARHGPRTIDVDVLLVDGATLADDALELPHPELARRRFVLEPLGELAPGLILPDGRTPAQALAEIGAAQRVEPVGSLGP